MKKYVMLYTFTTLLIAAVAIFGTISRNSVVTVNTVKVDSLTVENSVTCSGRVERISTTSVSAPASALVKNVYVKAGDTVKAGQSLMLVEIPSEKIDTSKIDASDLPSGYESLLGQYSDQLQSESENATTFQTIAAPVAGEVTSVSVANQSYVASGVPVAVIADNSGLQVRLSVNESQISDIKVGQKAVITGVGFKNSSYSGTVKAISSDAKQIVSTTGQETVVEVIVSVDDAGKDIKPGYTSKVKIITSRNSGVLVAPYEAVRADKNGNEYVFKLKGNKAVKTPVVTRKEFDDGFEVTSGLSNNDVIIESPDNLSNGTRVIPSSKGTVSSDD